MDKDIINWLLSTGLLIIVSLRLYSKNKKNNQNRSRITDIESTLYTLESQAIKLWTNAKEDKETSEQEQKNLILNVDQLVSKIHRIYRLNGKAANSSLITSLRQSLTLDTITVQNRKTKISSAIHNLIRDLDKKL